MPDVIDPSTPVEFAMDIEPISINPAPNSGMLVNRASGQTDVYPMVEQFNEHRVTFSESSVLKKSGTTSIDTTSGDKIYPGGSDGVTYSLPPLVPLRMSPLLTTALNPTWDGQSLEMPPTVAGLVAPIQDCDAAIQPQLRMVRRRMTDNSNNGGDCNSDVDGGQTILTSPARCHQPESIIRTPAGWTISSVLYEDPMTIEVSSDDGASWTLLGWLTRGGGQWRLVRQAFRIGDFVENTDTFEFASLPRTPGTVPWLRPAWTPS